MICPLVGEPITPKKKHVTPLKFKVTLDPGSNPGGSTNNSRKGLSEKCEFSLRVRQDMDQATPRKGEYARQVKARLWY